MRSLGKWLGRVLLALLVLAAAAWLILPGEPVDTDIGFGTALSADRLDTYFAEAEARFDDITPGVEKRVIWAGTPGARTGVSVVYIHGFSATSEEIRPVPDLVARALGANLVYTRLSGHGRDGAALAEPAAGDWLEDVAEALAAARAAGDRTLVIATSTGGTLAALAAMHPDLSASIDAIAFVSPNFAIANALSAILTWPGARWWVPLAAGTERAWQPLNDDHRRYWTTRYPTVALLPMMALVKHVAKQDPGRATVPAMFLFSDADAVVSAAATRDVADRWGGEVALAPQKLPPGNDPYNHVIGGDVLSPGMTESVAKQIAGWARSLGL
ncbi:MAG: alpha/beta fold hydrolase [Rhodobacter sp.]|nr:alpha/beta fold hydrolase [Rhodobacter sp.]